MSGQAKQKRSTGLMSIAIVYILISVLLGAVGQIMLKNGLNTMGALTLSLGNLGGTLWRLVTNPYVFLGLAVYMTGTFFGLPGFHVWI